MLFLRNVFMDTVKSMSPGGKIFFRDSTEKGSFEVLCLKKCKGLLDKVLMKAVFQTEDSNIFSDDAGVIGEPFYADAQDVYTALAGKEQFAEYKDGLFDGVSLKSRCVLDPDKINPNNRLSADNMQWYLEQYEKSAPLAAFTLPAGQHQIITRNIKKFVSDDQTRAYLCGICFHFFDKNDIRVAATNGRSLAVYKDLAGDFDESQKNSKWTVSSDMLFVPPFNYESAVVEFSKEVVKVVVRGRDFDPVVTAYAVPFEWLNLRNERHALKNAVASGEKEKIIKEHAKSIEDFLKEPQSVFPNYIKVIPEGNTDKLILSREEITLAIEKLKRSLDGGRIIVIDAYDPKNIFIYLQKTTGYAGET
jgi:hypothetical protein